MSQIAEKLVQSSIKLKKYSTWREKKKKNKLVAEFPYQEKLKDIFCRWHGVGKQVPAIIGSSRYFTFWLGRITAIKRVNWFSAHDNFLFCLSLKICSTGEDFFNLIILS